MIHINGVGYCNESGAQMAVNDLLKVNQQQAEQLELYASRWASAMSEITKLQAELAASQSSHKALETLYLQVRDEELVEAKAEAEKYRDTLYSAKMMDKDKEIQRLKERLDVAEDVIHRNELTVYYRQALAAQPQKESECNV